FSPRVRKTKYIGTILIGLVGLLNISSDHHGCISTMYWPAATDGSASAHAFASAADGARNTNTPIISPSSVNGPAMIALPELSVASTYFTCSCCRRFVSGDSAAVHFGPRFRSAM